MILNRKQIKQLYEITDRFNDISEFEIIESTDSGIGQAVIVKFNLLSDQSSTSIDITDYDTW